MRRRLHPQTCVAAVLGARAVSTANRACFNPACHVAGISPGASAANGRTRPEESRQAVVIYRLIEVPPLRGAASMAMTSHRHGGRLLQASFQGSDVRDATLVSIGETGWKGKPAAFAIQPTSRLAGWSSVSTRDIAASLEAKRLVLSTIYSGAVLEISSSQPPCTAVDSRRRLCQRMAGEESRGDCPGSDDVRRPARVQHDSRGTPAGWWTRRRVGGIFAKQQKARAVHDIIPGVPRPPPPFRPWGAAAAASVRSCVRIVSRASRCFFPSLEICTTS